MKTAHETQRNVQLSRLAIAQITTAKRKLNKSAYTTQQLHDIQRFVNKLEKNKDKDFIIVF